MPDIPTLLLGLIFGSIGLAYSIYGKRQSNTVARYAGFVLMIPPYFIQSPAGIVAVGILLMALPALFRG